MIRELRAPAFSPLPSPRPPRASPSPARPTTAGGAFPSSPSAAPATPTISRSTSPTARSRSRGSYKRLRPRRQGRRRLRQVAARDKSASGSGKLSPAVGHGRWTGRSGSDHLLGHLDRATRLRRRSALHAEQLDIEHQRGVRRDHPAGAARAIAERGGMISVRLPPIFIDATPSSQPLMTRPWPIGNSNASLRSTEESNFLPLAPFS